MSSDEKLVHINSSYKTSGTNCNFFINFNNAIHLQNAIYSRLKSITVPNLFPNIYGKSNIFLIRSSGVLYQLSIPYGNYSASDLVNALNNAFTDQTLDIVATYSSNRFQLNSPTITFSVPSIKSSQEILSTQRTLNEIMGASISEETDSSSWTAVDPPSLFGPAKIFIVSDRMAFGYSVHGNGSIHSKLGSLSLSNVPYGNLAHLEIPERANNQIYFKDHRQLNSLDIQLIDEFDRQVELPSNSHVNIEFIVGFTI